MSFLVSETERSLQLNRVSVTSVLSPTVSVTSNSRNRTGPLPTKISGQGQQIPRETRPGFPVLATSSYPTPSRMQPAKVTSRGRRIGHPAQGIGIVAHGRSQAVGVLEQPGRVQAGDITVARHIGHPLLKRIQIIRTDRGSGDVRGILRTQSRRPRIILRKLRDRVISPDELGKAVISVRICDRGEGHGQAIAEVGSLLDHRDAWKRESRAEAGESS